MSSSETERPTATSELRPEGKELRRSRLPTAAVVVRIELGEWPVELTVYRTEEAAYAVWCNAIDGVVFFVELLETQ